MSDQAVIISKLFSYGGYILAKGQLDHSYTFWAMANYTTGVCPNFFETDVMYLVSAETIIFWIQKLLSIQIVATIFQFFT